MALHRAAQVLDEAEGLLVLFVSEETPREKERVSGEEKRVLMVEGGVGADEFGQRLPMEEVRFEIAEMEDQGMEQGVPLRFERAAGT